VQGNNYNLYRIGTGGDAIGLLNGPLRDYSAFSGPIDPYETPDFLFLGDDTTSAQAGVQIARVALPFAVVPEPGTLGLLAAALIGGGLLRRGRADAGQQRGGRPIQIHGRVRVPLQNRGGNVGGDRPFQGRSNGLGLAGVGHAAKNDFGL